MSERMRRVNEAVRSVVAEGVRDLKDPRIGLVTVTGVVVTPDLQEATVFVSVLGNEKVRQATLVGLDVGPRRVASADQQRAEPPQDSHADVRIR